MHPLPLSDVSTSPFNPDRACAAMRPVYVTIHAPAVVVVVVVVDTETGPSRLGNNTSHCSRHEIRAEKKRPAKKKVVVVGPGELVESGEEGTKAEPKRRGRAKKQVTEEMLGEPTDLEAKPIPEKQPRAKRQVVVIAPAEPGDSKSTLGQLVSELDAPAVDIESKPKRRGRLKNEVVASELNATAGDTEPKPKPKRSGRSKTETVTGELGPPAELEIENEKLASELEARVVDEEPEPKPERRSKAKEEELPENPGELGSANNPETETEPATTLELATVAAKSQPGPKKKPRAKKEVATKEPAELSESGTTIFGQMALEFESMAVKAASAPKPKRTPRTKKEEVAEEPRESEEAEGSILCSEEKPATRGSKAKDPDEPPKKRGAKPKHLRDSDREYKPPGPKPGSKRKVVKRPAKENLMEGIKSERKQMQMRLLQAHGPVAERLAATGTWSVGKRTDAARALAGDKTRVNITSESLCDDALNYIKPTLTPRHDGCDIVDLFPGAGLFSRKLNDLLKPRSHILLEPDEQLYTPFLEPLLERPGTKLLPKSGIIWEELEEVLSPEHLPHQVKRKYGPDEAPERNDTLLVVANIAMWPKKRFRTFASVANLVLFQFISSMRTAALFQQYGRVRMLMWVEDSDKAPLLPRTIQRRRRSSIDVEINTEWLCEIAGAGRGTAVSSADTWFRRDTNLDVQSLEMTLARMNETGISPIPGRESADLREYLEKTAQGVRPLSDPLGARTYTKESRSTRLYTKLDEAYERGEIETGSHLYKRMKAMQYVQTMEDKRFTESLDEVDKRKEIEQMLIKAERSNDPIALEKAKEAEKAWEEKMSAEYAQEKKRGDYLLQRDNALALEKDPPILVWDRRYVEPLRVEPEEFFPNVPCALLDIQPAALDPVLRDQGPNSNRGGDMFELILPGLISHPTANMEKAFENTYVGASTGVLPYCPSLTDPKQGGTPLKGSYGGLTPRVLSGKQFVDIARSWSKWLFKPSWEEMVVKQTEGDVEVDENDLRDFRPMDAED